jgi:carbonic anhydrase/acetyltransferase-like protein (isoleucine patch superfamily)
MLHGCTIGDDSLIMGSPAKAVKELTPEAIAGMAENTATYIRRTANYRETLEAIG